jgi:hypothetical protein
VRIVKNAKVAPMKGASIVFTFSPTAFLLRLAKNVIKVKFFIIILNKKKNLFRKLNSHFLREITLLLINLIFKLN